MLLLMKIIFSTVEFSATVLLCLSMFRIYFRYSLYKVFFIAFVMALLSVFIRDVIDETLFATLPVLITEIILITLLFRLPLIFSLLLCVIGTAAVVTIEGFVLSIGSNFNLFSEQMLKTSITQFVMFDLIVTVIILLLVYPLQRYKLGFHTTSNDALKGYNFYLSGVLVVAVIALQVEVLAFKVSYVYIAIPIFIGFIFLIGIYLAYKHNRKLWKNRRERLSNR
ncbi:hypothetical protein [Paenibacillus sp. FSL H7-0331]|uniref:hypothetical protein n=1 Tax=Paenibacillus sp. FSL H7-0331 TaxID=1920421 RepID=UPI00096FB77E|nr:hypothetical protein [Paenibacillus sp. FSL H7-0331]OMF19494.1 hypothetical protein BK127_06010 [Paenibacillus sp. FSL H7-0331]